MSSLYRPEAVDFRKRRIDGDLIITRSVPLTLVALLLSAITVTLACLALFGHYSRTETVSGEVVPTGVISKIYADRAGRIIWLGVHEGDFVRRGQAIMRIKVEQALDDGRSPNDARIASLADQIALTHRQIDNEDQRDVAEHSRLTQLVRELDNEHGELASQVELQKAAVDSTRRSFDAMTALVARGFVSRSDYEARRQAWLAAATQFQAAVQQMSQLSERRSEILAQIAKLPGDHSSKLADLSNALAELQQHDIDAEGARGFTITAPVAGRVTALQAMAGRSTDGRLPLLSIMPEGATMEATLFAPSRAVGMARAGQVVRLRYDAFPSQRFGSFDGRIVGISRSILAPDEVDAPIKLTEPVYRLRVALNRQTVPAFGEALPLEPGMTLQADIVLDRRTFLDWLLEPVRAVGARG